MKNFPAKLFERYAVNKHRTTFGVLYIFDRNFDRDCYFKVIDKKSTPHIKVRGFKSEVHIYCDWVCKSEYRPFRKRFKYLHYSAADTYGHKGAIGEAVNTLVANLLGYPCHRLLATYVNPITGNVKSIYSRVKSATPLMELLQREHLIDQRKKLLSRVILQLFSTLDSKIFHADCNASNIFYNPEGDEIQLIDLEAAIQINIGKNIAMGALLSSFYDHRLNKLISRDDFTGLFKETLEHAFNHDELRLLLEEFNRHNLSRRLRHERHDRLDRVGNNNSALSKLVIF